MPIGIALTLIIGAYLGYNLFEGDKSLFLGGETSHGHYQIELECQACHTTPFASQEKMQQACESCHAEELDRVNDSHPKKVFLDPRNADLLATLDARLCVSCHREHKPEITRDFGVTLAADFCFHCHQDIKEERPSHAEFEFKTCATSGCHNFHDNSMLYEKFIAKHLDEPAIKDPARLPEKTGLKRWLKKNKKKLPLDVAEPQMDSFSFEATNQATVDLSRVVEDWKSSIHARTDANCTSCHTQNVSQNHNSFTIASVAPVCESCHKRQHKAFLESKHGMRLALELSPMSTDKARLEVDKSHSKSLDCNSCHNPHSLNVVEAAMDSCLGCHQDTHSQNYKNSKHYQLWAQEILGEAPSGSGVSCATCHLPKVKKGRRVTVIHNQNLNLRPNTKMLRSVCMNCHGLEFSVSALADEALIENNFIGIPTKKHQTFELVKQRMKSRQ
ncbi:hypothetical protein FLL45_14290 [Aliikangiella marina]|uniref:nitrite reductase (cytochrome; ammonia-forming) n=2 Tax=Aliikangiella marina TaxID=1712262 RepID=A0A545TAC0_9GAMM|nr:hypothetical protein FLL45_14290 [Aliikangiella marina]